MFKIPTWLGFSIVCLILTSWVLVYIYIGDPQALEYWRTTVAFMHRIFEMWMPG